MLAFPPPSPGLSLILCYLEAINKTLKGCQSNNVEVEPPPSRVGNPKVARESEGGPPPGDIKSELQKIKLPKFLGGHASEGVESWLEGMT